MNENDVLFQKVTQAYSEKNFPSMPVSLSGIIHHSTCVIVKLSTMKGKQELGHMHLATSKSPCWLSSPKKIPNQFSADIASNKNREMSVINPLSPSGHQHLISPYVTP